jgi:hypothetical protein
MKCVHGQYQKRWTAMGTKMAPTYATLVLGYLEHILYEQLLNSYGQEFASYVRQNWKRFLDNCFIIWNSWHSRWNNSLNDQIKRNVYFNMFRVTGSEIKIHMGVSIFRENVPLLCCYLLIYELERLKTTFLFASIKINIPFNLASRIITITKTAELRHTRLRERLYLKNQQYPEETVSYLRYCFSICFIKWKIL